MLTTYDGSEGDDDDDAAAETGVEVEADLEEAEEGRRSPSVHSLVPHAMTLSDHPPSRRCRSTMKAHALSIRSRSLCIDSYG